MAVLRRISGDERWVIDRARKIETKHLRNNSGVGGRDLSFESTPEWCFAQARREWASNQQAAQAQAKDGKP